MSVASAAEAFRREHDHLDVLVNKAGIVGPRGPLPEVTASEAASAFETNVFGVIRLTRAFPPLLRAAAQPRIVNVSSGVGSFTRNWEAGSDESQVPPLIYAVTKTALAMLTLQHARALPGVQVNAADPGYTATDLNSRRGRQSVTEGTDAIVHLATLPADGPTGVFVGRDGAVPW